MANRHESRSGPTQLAAALAPAGVLAAMGAGWVWAARGTDWWAQALRSPLFVRCGLVLMGCTLALQIVLTAMFRLGRRRGGLSADQRGVAVLEFALVFPIAMAIVLVMVQTAMLMAGNLLVHYAAYSATRSAVVWIPRDLSDEEPRNVVDSDVDASAKVRTIRRAAVLALVPAATGVPPDAARQADPMWRRRFERFLAEDASSAEWLGRWPLDTAFAYAEQHTQVTLDPPAGIAPDDADDGKADGLVDSGSAAAPYGKREDITVSVRHELYLWVPYANRVFGRRLQGRPGHYATAVTASYTLVNQGRYDNVVTEYSKDTGEALLPSW